MAMNAAIQKAIQHFGSAKKLADALQVQPPSLHQWLYEKRPIPVERCIDIERVTDGAVTVEEILPLVPWHVVRAKPAAEPQKVA